MSYVLKVKTRYKSDRTGREIVLPALLTKDGLLVSHLRYLANHVRKSQSWKERSTFAISLLVKYMYANESAFASLREMLSGFSQVLEFGSINVISMDDPSGLYWNPRKTEDARALLAHITAHTDWLCEASEYKINRANPFRRASSVEQRLNWSAYYHKEEHVFLAHLNSPSNIEAKIKFVRTVSVSRESTASGRDSKRFSESNINALLEKGWIRKDVRNGPSHSSIDYKGQAITLLQHYGGVRKSEALQLYLIDIIVDPIRNEALVRVHHPATGSVPDESYVNRRDYLHRRYQLVPRTDYPRSVALHCGWKTPLLSDQENGYFEVMFFPTKFAQVFLYTFIMYLKHQRVDPPVGADHPYAFTNSSGHPETLNNFSRHHKKAVERIGLEHRKSLGTTEHGHRHAYGKRLKRAGLSRVEIQKAMHHKDPSSSLVYGSPEGEDIRAAFERAEVAAAAECPSTLDRGNPL